MYFSQKPGFCYFASERNVILKLFALKMLWLTVGGSKVPDSQKEKDLEGLVKFTMSTDLLEIKFSKRKSVTFITPMILHMRYSCTQF